MIIQLTNNEILQFQYILPVQGSLSTLELVEKILNKVKFLDKKEIGSQSIREVDFDEKEIFFITEMINILDENQQLRYDSLSLVKKILKEKGDK
jgi:hypothetical protein